MELASGALTQTTQASDEALLSAFGQGDRRAAAELARRLAPRLLRFATRMLGGDGAEAEDVTQETMLRLWRLAPDWRPGEAQVATWAFRVASNLCTDRLRKRGRIDPGEVPEVEDPGADAVARLAARERAEAVARALGDLPERQRQAVLLRHMEGLSNPEIAEIMQTSTEAVESLTARGKRALAARLAAQEKEEPDGTANG